MIWLLGWLDPLHGDGYQFWSGIGAGVPGLVGASLLYWRHHNCYEHGCWRVGHPHPDHGHRPVCHRHR